MLSSSNADAGRADYISTGETAARLGVSRWTVRRMVQAGELDAIEVHGMLRVSQCSVETYIADHRHNRGA